MTTSLLSQNRARVEGLSQSRVGFPRMVTGPLVGAADPRGARDGPPESLRVAWGLLTAYANDFMAKLYNSMLTFANTSMSCRQCYACV